MARLVALEWDAREARVAVGRSRGKDVVIENAFAVELVPRDPGQTFADVNIGQKVAAALAARGITRPDVLVAVGRASIELRLLQLPPAPPAELPDLARFQAMRQFATIGEDWSLDFVELEDKDAESLSVLAAAISPELVGQIQQTCQAGEMRPIHMVLRPFAAASLLRRGRNQAAVCQLMVDVLTDEADLTVVVNDRVAFIRTVRLPPEADEQTHARALLGEIRRTIGAAQNQLRDRRIEAITLCGGASEHAAVKELLEQHLKLPVASFEPFEYVTLGKDIREQRPDQSGRYAPLLGMLLDESEGRRHDIDFLNPRKRPKAEGQGRRTLALAGAVALLLLMMAGLIVQRLWSLDAEIGRLQEQSRGMDKSVTWSNERLGQVAQIEEFTQADVTWLDEFHQLSQRVLPADEARVTKLTLSSRPPMGGRMVLEGYVRESSLIGKLEDELRDDAHRVVGKGGSYDEIRRQFPWRFNETITVELDKLEQDEDGQTPAEETTP